jgi:hypothetical protein
MNTGVGDTLIVSPISALAVGSTRIEVILVLFAGVGSRVEEFVTVAELRMVVPAAVPALTFMVSVSVLALAPLLSTALYVQTIGPVPLTAGVVQIQFVPAAAWNVVLAGVCR